MIIVLGDSHSRTIDVALQANSQGSRPPILTAPLFSNSAFWQPFFVERDQEIGLDHEEMRLNLKYCVDLDTIKRDDTVVLGLCVGHFYPWFINNRAWFKYTLATANASKKHFISAGVAKRALESRLQHVFSFYDTLKAIGQRFFVIESPPPGPHSLGVSDPRRMDEAIDAVRFYRAFYRDFMRERDITFLTAPEGTSDDNGLLLPAFHRDDPRDAHHGNTQYGILVVEQILALAEKLYPDSLNPADWSRNEAITYLKFQEDFKLKMELLAREKEESV